VSTDAEGIDGSGEPIRELKPLIFDISGALLLPWHAVLIDYNIYIDDFRFIHQRWRRQGFWIPPEWIGVRGYDDGTGECVVAMPPDEIAIEPKKTYFLFNANQGETN